MTNQTALHKQVPPTSKKRKRLNKKIRAKFEELEQAAAARTLNSNGCNPSFHIPPLFFCSNKHHPYGALPYGNIYSDENITGDSVRRRGLGDLRVLNDDQLLHGVLTYLDGHSLGRSVQCSRYLYVCGMVDSLWRDLVLRRTAATAAEETEDGVDYWHTWRDTYCFMVTALRANQNSQQIISNGEANKKNDPQTTAMSSGAPSVLISISKPKRHVPIPIKGVYSDIIYRTWLCQSFQINEHEEFTSVDNIARENHKTLTAQQFLNKYEATNTPVVIEGATEEWPALHKWKDTDYLIRTTTTTTATNGKKKPCLFRATSACAPLPAQFAMESYCRYAENAVEEMPLYLFDRNFDKLAPDLLSDYQSALYKSCPYFDPLQHSHDLFSLLGADHRPDHRWLIIGPKQSGSAFHIDPNATHAWNAPIRGRKRWIFYPPGIPPPGVLPSSDGDEVTMPISIGEWYLSFWSAHLKQRRHPDRNKRPIECTVSPGSILFVPHGWWHTVMNLDGPVNIALTQNYVSASNLSDVLRFCKRKRQQISGCRDRSNDGAVQPECLYDEFVRVLEERYTDDSSKCMLNLSAVKKKAEKGWCCAAWNDDNDMDGIENLSQQQQQQRRNKSVVVQAKDDLKKEEGGLGVVGGSMSSFSFSFNFQT